MYYLGFFQFSKFLQLFKDVVSWLYACHSAKSVLRTKQYIWVSIDKRYNKHNKWPDSVLIFVLCLPLPVNWSQESFWKLLQTNKHIPLEKWPQTGASMFDFQIFGLFSDIITVVNDKQKSSV